MFGATEKPYIQEYMVGPLPITEKSTVQPDNFRTNRGGDGKVSVLNADPDAYAIFDSSVMADAADVTKFLWNLVSERALEISRKCVLII